MRLVLSRSLQKLKGYGSGKVAGNHPQNLITTLSDMGENPILEETSDSLPDHAEWAASHRAKLVTGRNQRLKQVATLAKTGGMAWINKS